MSNGTSTAIVGERRMGKSTLLCYLHDRPHEFLPVGQRPLILHLDLTRSYSRSCAKLMRELRRQLTRLWREPWSADDDNDVTLFSEALEEDGYRVILLIDEFERISQKLDEFYDMLEDWRALASSHQWLTIVTASARSLAVLCQQDGLTSPFHNIFEPVQLGLFEPSIARQRLNSYLALTATDHTFVEQVSGYQPFLLEMTASDLWATAVRGEQINHRALYHTLQPRMLAHFRDWWRKLTPAEQAVLAPTPHTADHLTARQRERLQRDLTYRGFLRKGRPFSRMWTDLMDEL